MARTYRIGDFARELDVSADFIKYYEKLNLLAPEKNERNNYRFLEFQQSRWTLEIRKFRNLGFSAEEIAGLLNGDSTDAILSSLKKKQAEQDRAVRWFSLVNRHFDLIERCLSRCASGSSWTIEPAEPGYFLPHTEGKEFITTQDTRERFSEWARFLPVVQSCCLADISSSGASCRSSPDAPDSERSATAGTAAAQQVPHISRFRFGLFVLKQDAEILGISLKEPALRLPFQTCAVYCHCSPVEARIEDINVADFELTGILRHHNFSLDGPVLALRLLTYRQGDEQWKLELVYAPLANDTTSAR